MNKNIRKAFSKEYNNNGYDSARELTLELLDQYRTLLRYQSSDNRQETIDGVQCTLDAIDMNYWRDDTSPDQVLEMIREIERYLLILKSSGSFLIMEEKVNTALKRCIDILTTA